MGWRSRQGDSLRMRLARTCFNECMATPLALTGPHLPQWQPLLPITPLGPAQRHLFLLPSASQPVTHLKLTMHPDGGLGRFRAYGRVIPPPAPAHPTGEAVDLAYVLNGGTVTGESDQHFGRGGNLILPGRGKDMGDGWETRRSRGRLGTGKGDWVVVKLCVFGTCSLARRKVFLGVLTDLLGICAVPSRATSSGSISTRCTLSATSPTRPSSTGSTPRRYV